MTGLLWFLAIVLLVLTVVDPRKLWYSTTAWQFKHPEANEPSEASFALGRIVSGVGALGFGIAALFMTADGLAPLSQERLDSAGQDAARTLSGEFSKYGSPGVSAIETALDLDGVRVTEGETVTDDSEFGESYGIRELYSVEGVDDPSIAGCFEVSYNGGLFHEGDIDVRTSYSAGEC